MNIEEWWHYLTIGDGIIIGIIVVVALAVGLVVGSYVARKIQKSRLDTEQASVDQMRTVSLQRSVDRLNVEVDVYLHRAQQDAEQERQEGSDDAE